MGNSLLSCCIPSRNGLGISGDGDECKSFATNRVELAASELFTVPGLAVAYHTSVLVNGEEFFFSDSGIFWDRALTSHQGEPSELVDLGFSSRTGAQLLAALQEHFKPGSYDLIRKNCNSFSDCALHYLLRKRLDRKYSALERLGQRASPDLLHKFTKGMYEPNQVAVTFEVDKVIGVLDELGDDAGKTPGEEPQRHSRPALAIGASVTVVGLKSAEILNGQGAVIHRYNGVNGRWEARLNFSGEVKSLRAENLRPAGELVLETGDVCRIHGLKSDSGLALNGLQGEVIRYLHENSRYEVRFGPDVVKALRPENLQVVAALEE